MALRKQYEQIVNEYIHFFSLKHDIELDFWVADQIGTVGSFGDYFFSFDDIRLDIDYGIPKKHLFKWYETSLEEHTKNGYSLSYYTYLLNTPRGGVIRKKLKRKFKN